MHSEQDLHISLREYLSKAKCLIDGNLWHVNHLNFFLWVIYKFIQVLAVEDTMQVKGATAFARHGETYKFIFKR